MSAAPPVRVRELLADAVRLLDDPIDDVGVAWNRAAAVLTRQAIEQTVNQFWSVACPDMRRANWAEKWMAMPAYFGDPAAANAVARAHYAWEALSESCHHRGYDLGLTEAELRGHLATTVLLARAVARHMQPPSRA